MAAAASTLSTPIILVLTTLLFLSSTFSFTGACTTRCRPKPTPMEPPVNSCPRDTLKLGACVDLLGGVVNLVVGSPASSTCCAVLEGLADLEVAACLCTAIKANVLGINLNVPVTLSVLVSACGKSIPPGFQCG